MNLVVAEAMAEIRSRQLDLEQQGRLALAWMDVYVMGCGAGADEGTWRKSLGYSEEEWEGVRSVYRDVLEHGDGWWGLRFLHAEVVRQGQVSAKQRGNVERRYGGIPKPTVVESGIPEPTTVYHAPTVVYPTTATATAKKNKPSERVVPMRFLEFWELYRNEKGRRTNKPGCLALWAKEGLESQAEAILGGLRAYRETEAWRTGYMVTADRFLKRRMWEDDHGPEKGEEW